jgi:hypothetical protein
VAPTDGAFERSADPSDGELVDVEPSARETRIDRLADVTLDKPDQATYLPARTAARLTGHRGPAQNSGQQEGVPQQRKDGTNGWWCMFPRRRVAT